MYTFSGLYRKAYIPNPYTPLVFSLCWEKKIKEKRSSQLFHSASRNIGHFPLSIPSDTFNTQQHPSTWDSVPPTREGT